MLKIIKKESGSKPSISFAQQFTCQCTGRSLRGCQLEASYGVPQLHARVAGDSARFSFDCRESSAI